MARSQRSEFEVFCGEIAAVTRSQRGCADIRRKRGYELPHSCSRVRWMLSRDGMAKRVLERLSGFRDKGYIG